MDNGYIWSCEDVTMVAPAGCALDILRAAIGRRGPQTGAGEGVMRDAADPRPATSAPVEVTRRYSAYEA
jgi:hypothetical protein